MSESHDLPDAPDGWKVTTNVGKTINYLYVGGDRRAIIVTPMQDARLDRWKARVFGGFDGDRPLVAKDEGFEGVIEAATDTMESITAGSEVSTVPDVRDDAEDDDTDQLDEDQPESDVDGEPEQTGLEKWG